MICDDDRDAIELAKHSLDGQDLQVWQGARLVAASWACAPSAPARGPWTENNDAALFDGRSDPYWSAAAAFLPTLTDTIEAIASTAPGD